MDIWCFQITWYYPRASLACCNIHNPAGKIFSNETTVWSSLNVYLFVWGAGRGPGSFSAAERTPPLSLTTITTNVARSIPEAKLLICGSSLLFLSSLLPPNHSAQEKTNVWINFFLRIYRHLGFGEPREALWPIRSHCRQMRPLHRF